MSHAFEHLLECPILQNATVIQFKWLCYNTYTHRQTKGSLVPAELVDLVESGTAGDTITVVIISWLPHIMSLNAPAQTTTILLAKGHI